MTSSSPADWLAQGQAALQTGDRAAAAQQVHELLSRRQRELG